MAAKKGGTKKTKKNLNKPILQQDVEKEDLDRFAGSSDEEEEEEVTMASPAPVEQGDEQDDAESDIDGEDETGGGDDKAENEDGDDDGDDDSSTSSIEKEANPAFKMASVMGRILGDDNKKKTTATTTSVVLGKTVTPLQRLQQQEKEKLKALTEKRKANRERNLSALHYPLSIATSHQVQTEGRLSVAKELEQERYHRRVATRGVVALFNAISQHQRSNNQQHDAPTTSKTATEVPKMTKHSFLDKIKSAAKSKLSTNDNNSSKNKRQFDSVVGEEKPKESKGSSPSWGALKDDYMLNPKKNWDEESSDEEDDPEIIEDDSNNMEEEKPKKKLRAGGRH